MKLNIQTIGACAALAFTALIALPHSASAQTKTSVGSASNFGGQTTLFTFIPFTGPINSGSTPGTPSAVTASTTDGSVTLPGAFTFTSNASGAGSFDIVSGTKTLLEGTFSNLVQNGPTADPTDFIISTDDVTYTGGADLLSAGFVAGDTGNLSLTFIGVNPGMGTGPQTASSFTSSFDVITTSTATPEPSGLIVFGILGAGLLGAVMLRRKQSGSFTA